VLLLIVLLMPAVAHAELYQWTDENGVKHFSNTPPTENVDEVRQMEEIVGDDTPDTDYLQDAIDLFKTDDDQHAAVPARHTKGTPKVVMYTTPTCGYCHRAKAYFNQKGIRFTEYDVTQSQQARKAFKALNGRGVPLIVIGDQRISGFNKAAINRALGLK
jgi:glutaredoxin-like YruB-family protein